jgi:hypothetical protein
MSKRRLLFYAIFAIFHLFIFLFTLYVEGNKDDLGFLMNILKRITLMKYGAILGLILVSLDVIWSWIINRDAEIEKEVLTKEINTLKAKIFDLQEAAQKTTPPSSTLPPTL